LVYAELQINGEVVNQIIWNPGDPDYVAMLPSVMFDSTHFANGSTVTVTVRSEEDLGHGGQASASAPVKNFASLFGRYDLESSVPIAWNWDDPVGYYFIGDMSWHGLPWAAAFLSSMGYYIEHQVTSRGWGSGDLLAGLADCTVFYVHTHGATTYYWTDLNDFYNWYPAAPESWSENAYASSTGGDPYGFVLEPTRVNAMGSGLPPFNSTGLPPIALSFMVACDTGTNNDFAEAYLYPYTNAYVNPAIEDQSELGYNLPFELRSDCGRAVSVLDVPCRRVHGRGGPDCGLQCL